MVLLARCFVLNLFNMANCKTTKRDFFYLHQRHFQNHNKAIKHLNNKIDRIIVDEVHFMVTKNDFHSAYDCVRAYLACSTTPIMLFTATLQPHHEKVLLTQLGFSNHSKQADLMYIYHGKAIFLLECKSVCISNLVASLIYF